MSCNGDRHVQQSRFDLIDDAERLALEFYDRWLPGTMRRITGITGTCMPHCVMLSGPGDWAAHEPFLCER